MYQIRIKGLLDQQWSDWFSPLEIFNESNGECTLTGPVRDQAELHSLIDKAFNLNLTLLAVNCLQDTPVQRYALSIFFTASVILGWLATWVVINIPSNPVILSLLAFPVSYAPTFMALLMLHWAGGPEERSAFHQPLKRWRVGVRWYIVALLILPLLSVIGTMLATFSGGSIPFHPTLFGLLPLFLITNLGEEIGWRGYALPRLQTRFNSLISSLILGAVWSIYHWVALSGNENPWGFILVSTIYFLAMSVVMTWVFNHTRGSVPIMVLTHAMYDVVSIGVVPIVETNAPLLTLALGAGVACLMAFALVIVEGVDLGKRPA
jgi:membrane protease YdiL (CAAX protease family)